MEKSSNFYHTKVLPDSNNFRTSYLEDYFVNRCKAVISKDKGSDSEEGVPATDPPCRTVTQRIGRALILKDVQPNHGPCDETSVREPEMGSGTNLLGRVRGSRIKIRIILQNPSGQSILFYCWKIDADWKSIQPAAVWQSGRYWLYNQLIRNAIPLHFNSLPRDSPCRHCPPDTACGVHGGVFREVSGPAALPACRTHILMVGRFPKERTGHGFRSDAGGAVFRPTFCRITDNVRTPAGDGRSQNGIGGRGGAIALRGMEMRKKINAYNQREIKA